MLKRRRTNKTKQEKSHVRFLQLKRTDSRQFRPSQRCDYERTVFACWKSKEKGKMNANKLTGQQSELKTENGPTITAEDYRNQNTEIKTRSYYSNQNNCQKEKPNVQNKNINQRKHKESSKHLYDELCHLIQTQEVHNERNNVMTVHDGFVDELTTLGVALNQNRFKMNLESKIKQFNSILKGKSSPNGGRSMKRKQNENGESELPARLLTPSKYVYNTPENQKYKPQMPVKQSPDLVPAVYQTSKKHKVLYDLDKNVARKISLQNYAPNELNVPIDKRFLKPICKNPYDDNQFLHLPYENSIDISAELNAVQNNTNNEENTFDFTFVNQESNYEDGNFNFTLQEIPHSSQYEPKPMTFEQEMNVKCTVRPAKIPRTNFYRHLSRKSLNFEASPRKPIEPPSYAENTFNFLPDSSEDNFTPEGMYNDTMQLNMNISMNGEDF